MRFMIKKEREGKKVNKGISPCISLYCGKLRADLISRTHGKEGGNQGEHAEARFVTERRGNHRSVRTCQTASMTRRRISMSSLAGNVASDVSASHVAHGCVQGAPGQPLRAHVQRRRPRATCANCARRGRAVEALQFAAVQRFLPGANRCRPRGNQSPR
jgi:hypothetical protein